MYIYKGKCLQISTLLTVESYGILEMTTIFRTLMLICKSDWTHLLECIRRDIFTCSQYKIS